MSEVVDTIMAMRYEWRTDLGSLSRVLEEGFAVVDARLANLEDNMRALTNAMMSDELIESYMTGGRGACREVWQERVRRLETLS